MDKYFICLANSYKHGGRCVAGIEVLPNPDGQLTIVRHDDGRPRWIRPVSMAETGEIPNQLALDVKLLSLVKLSGVVPCPDKAHTEDVHCSRMECCPDKLEVDDAFLSQLVDPIHQVVFYFRGKAIPATIINKLNYSLMLIRPEKASAYIDEEREKSKYRVKFTYSGSNYDFPITDPYFLEIFKKNPEKYADLNGAYLTLSLGLEFEGFHFKLVAAVLLPYKETKHAKTTSLDGAGSWFDKYERELARLLDLKKDVDDKITALRKELLQQMEIQGEEKIVSSRFTVNYAPPKTILQFDSKLFREENHELYAKYCKPKQKEASIIVRQNTPKE